MKSRHPTAVAVLTIVGAVLCALAVAGVVGYRFHLLRPFLYHPAIFGVPGGIALAAACWLALRQPVLRWVGVTLALMAAAGAGLLGWMVSTFDSDLTVESRYESPDGTVELVVYSGSAFMAPDPVWELRLHSGMGLLSREYDMGCVNADVQSLNSIDWIGPRTVRIQLSSGVVDVAVDEDGRPDRTVDGGC